MESISKENLTRLNVVAAKAAEPLGLMILRLTARGTPSRPIVEVILDGRKLVSIEDCQFVSRKLNDAIEENESLLKGNFRLDILSPGLDEPIIHDFQFQRTVGHLVEVTFISANVEEKVLGKLNDYNKTSVSVLKRHLKRGGIIENGELVQLPRHDIVKIFARPDFS